MGDQQSKPKPVEASQLRLFQERSFLESMVDKIGPLTYMSRTTYPVLQYETKQETKNSNNGKSL